MVVLSLDKPATRPKRLHLMLVDSGWLGPAPLGGRSADMNCEGGVGFGDRRAPEGPARLAPAYDEVPLTRYPGIEGRMAMAINDVCEHSRICRNDLIAEAGRWGLGGQAGPRRSSIRR